MIDLMKKRRSIRNLKKDPNINEQQIEKLLELSYQYIPTSFNMFEQYAVLLFNEEHIKLWDIVESTLKKIVPTENFERTQNRLNGFRKGNGTILFFTKTKVVEEAEINNDLYKQHFKNWANHSSGMHQIAMWLLLADKKLGASLQHYNPLIDDEVKKTFAIDQSYELVAQMPFGLSDEELDEKYIPENKQLFKVLK